MPISHPLKVIFVHIPKTAGTSIEYALGMHGKRTDVGLVPYVNQEPDHERLFGAGLQHMTARKMRTDLGGDCFDSYFKFSVVRNPWGRLVSAVSWKYNMWRKGESLSVNEFSNEVKWLYEIFQSGSLIKENSRIPLHFVPQVEFVCDDNKCLVDFIGRYENLTEDWSDICNLMGTQISLPYRMQSRHDDYRVYYTDETLRMVLDIYANDVKRFGYRFDN